MKAKYKAAVKLSLILCSPLLGALTGCVGYVEHPHEYAYTQPPPPPPVYAEPEYVYYPHYEVYYNVHNQQFIYRNGGSWVSSPAPHVSVDVLFASPSVRMEFHDHPSHHHASVVRQYPRYWAPTGRPDGPHYQYRY